PLYVGDTFRHAVISIAGGPLSEVIVDTGSHGLVVPPQDVNIATLGAPGPTGMLHYGNSVDYREETYTSYTAPVNLGNGIITKPTTVAVVTSLKVVQNGGPPITMPASEAPAFLGVGENTTGPIPSAVKALPDTLGQGVLLNQPGGYFEFGANPLPPGISVSGAPLATLDVTIGGNGQAPVTTTAPSAFIDSGVPFGWVPQDFLPSGQQGGAYVPAGDTITVSYNGTTLFTETVTGTAPELPMVVSNTDPFNTGGYPFTQGPIYLSYSPSGTGTMVFDT
ncbi:PecA family PE domain-processing aspartic protease, partial [Mycobacterium sp. E796]|uniref:PecA family PE domain-processing aspartic protease n=1 Tax=Mycobacterium sp. E796 TaxID=1834151 RepID=UPI000AE97699